MHLLSANIHSIMLTSVAIVALAVDSVYIDYYIEHLHCLLLSLKRFVIIII